MLPMGLGQLKVPYPDTLQDFDDGLDLGVVKPVRGRVSVHPAIMLLAQCAVGKAATLSHVSLPHCVYGALVTRVQRRCRVGTVRDERVDRVRLGVFVRQRD